MKMIILTGVPVLFAAGVFVSRSEKEAVAVPVSIEICETLFTGQQYQFTSQGVDSNGNLVSPVPNAVYTTANGSGSITRSGLYTAPSTPGTYRVYVYFRNPSGAIVSDSLYVKVVTGI